MSRDTRTWCFNMVCPHSGITMLSCIGSKYSQLPVITGYFYYIKYISLFIYIFELLSQKYYT